jgi:hypothetical protein
METMASRPFTRLLVNVTKTAAESKQNLLATNVSSNDDANLPDDASKNRESSIDALLMMPKIKKLMPVAVEPLSNNKTAILTCLLKLPQGTLSYTPKGSSPLVLASTYIQLTPSSTFINAQTTTATTTNTANNSNNNNSLSHQQQQQEQSQQANTDTIVFEEENFDDKNTEA